MRYLFVLTIALAGCSSTNWAKEGATSADLDADYQACVSESTVGIGTAGLVILGGAVGAAIGNTGKDERIRDCLRQKGWEAQASR